ncbi:rRNA adenine N-6-methyltransferase family protein [Nonomuraea sp. NPDC023979]|uniref:ribosomal RNA small subunit methyltransferase A n=1 Tax=Nonomuraea sp. NPDC023979 TaxID=3154796 RepID=UPI00340AB12F
MTRPSSQTTNRAGGARTTAGRARRTLSQNFLADRQAIDLMIRAADPAGLVLEPGAGAGALTLALAGAGARVIGYEIDPRLARRLAARTRDDPRVEVVHGDFTTAPVPGRPFAVVGNIPYSAILRIERRPEPLVRGRRTYQELVELGFSGLGGSVRASLRTRHRGVDAALAAAGVPRDAAVGHVHPDQWIALWQHLYW